MEEFSHIIEKLYQSFILNTSEHYFLKNVDFSISLNHQFEKFNKNSIFQNFKFLYDMIKRISPKIYAYLQDFIRGSRTKKML